MIRAARIVFVLLALGVMSVTGLGAAVSPSWILETARRGVERAA